MTAKPPVDPRRALPAHLHYLVPLERASADLAAGRILDSETREALLAWIRATIPERDSKDYQMVRSFWSRIDAGASLREASEATAEDFDYSSRTVQRRVVYGK